MERQVSKALVKLHSVGPGGTRVHLQPDLDQLVERINGIVTRKGLETAIEIGRLVLEEFYEGDIEVYRSRGRKDVGLRALAEREDLMLSASRLCRFVEIYGQLVDLPPHVARALPVSHHIQLLRIPDRAEKIRVAETAVAQSWTRERLSGRIRRIRGETGPTSKGGRPPLPPLVRLARSIEKAERAFVCDDEGYDPLLGMPPAEARASIDDLRTRLQKLEAEVVRLEASLTTGVGQPSA